MARGDDDDERLSALTDVVASLTPEVMRMSAQMSGGCRCGRVHHAAEVEGDDAYLCHCRMCQRVIGGIAVAWRPRSGRCSGTR